MKANVHVVVASRGEYSDRQQWCVEAHFDEEKAKARVEQLSAIEREFRQRAERYWDLNSLLQDELDSEAEAKGFSLYSETRYFLQTVELHP